MTGNTIYAGGEVFAKILQFVRELRPQLKTLGVLWDYAPPSFPQREVDVATDELRRAAGRLGIQLPMKHVAAPADVERSLTALAAAPLEALFVTSGPVTYVERERITRFIEERRLPSVSDFGLPEHWDRRLLTYSPDALDLARQTARYVDQIFRGAKPRDLPIQLPSKFELTINVRMAKAFGIVVPPSLLVRADRLLQ